MSPAVNTRFHTPSLFFRAQKPGRETTSLFSSSRLHNLRRSPSDAQPMMSKKRKECPLIRVPAMAQVHTRHWIKWITIS
ncbi:hypothetical protein E2C01_071839 [Portunus trituberculatus]|uniref:Uncharacterized protein n=1 Tax=Portunus trituberculatus TaxID=210409 RepID=A0A5B7I7B7_PORTR|nr:hypothetical protein [Portunus trituberculatus]